MKVFRRLKAHVFIKTYFSSCKSSNISIFDVLNIEVIQMTWVEGFMKILFKKMKVYKEKKISKND